MGTDYVGRVPSLSPPVRGLGAHDLPSLNPHVLILGSEHEVRSCLAVLGDI